MEITLSTIIYLTFLCISCLAMHYMAMQDFQTSEVTGEVCLINWAILLITFASIEGANWRGLNLVTCARAVVVIVLLLVFYLPVEVPGFGDADIIPLCAFFIFFCSDYIPFWVMAIYVGALVIVTPLYLVLWEKKSGQKWKFLQGVMVPCIPLFYGATVLTAVILVGLCICNCGCVGISWLADLKYQASVSYAIILIAACLMGGALDSAVACALYRKERQFSWVHGRSQCEHCGHQLSWWEVIPIVSGFTLRGRCRKCGHEFGLLMPCLELLAGAEMMTIVDFAFTRNTICGVYCTLLLLSQLLLEHKYINYMLRS